IFIFVFLLLQSLFNAFGSDVYLVLDRPTDWVSMTAHKYTSEDFPVKINSGLGVHLNNHLSLEFALQSFFSMQDSPELSQEGTSCGNSKNCFLFAVDGALFTIKYRF
ncbi:hypothetical protein, partial [Piscirickettsia salmonis]|uniref:hypothetical protein n=1 Tax=Piscirickettsia salmonis TaxID=1238 RepID=UPI003EBD075D